MNGAINPPSYSPNKFVNRNDEISIVMEKVQLLLQKKTPKRQVVIFQGERGTGKSWLLKELENRLNAAPGLTAYLLNLDEYRGQNPLLSIADILGKLQTTVTGQQPQTVPAIEEINRTFQQTVQPGLDNRPLVLLLDTVYESDWEILEALEKYILGAMVSHPNVVAVIAGRGRAYPWKVPEFRFSVQNEKLHPFLKEDFTKQQLRLQFEPSEAAQAHKIHTLSDGNPLANYLLAAYGGNPAPAFDQVITGMLDIIPQADNRRLVRHYLEALCVLEAFDEDRIPIMLAAYYQDDSYRHWNYARAKPVRDLLVKWGFAYWDTPQGGYILDATTRRLVEHFLKESTPQLYKGLHQAASELFKAWAQLSPDAKTRWQSKADYHGRQAA